MGNYIESILDEEYEGYRSIVRKVESPPKQTVREKTVWNDEEVESLLSKLTDAEEYERACFVALAAYSGRRKAELCRFKVSDFEDDKLVCGGALYKSDPIKTKGRGGGKYIPCYTLAKKFKPYLDAWLAYRVEQGIDSKWLFPCKGSPDEQLRTTTVDGWANSFSTLSGKDFYIHSLRHAYTTSLAKAGIPDSVIQSLVGWDSSDMVRLYDDTPKDEQIGAYFKDGDIAVKEGKSVSDL
jgi:integrase